MNEYFANAATFGVLKNKKEDVRLLAKPSTQFYVDNALKHVEEALFSTMSTCTIYDHTKDEIIQACKDHIMVKNRDTTPLVCLLYCPSELYAKRLEAAQFPVPALKYVQVGDYLEMRLDLSKPRPQNCGPVSAAMIDWYEYMNRNAPKKMRITVREGDKVVKEVDVDVANENSLTISL